MKPSWGSSSRDLRDLGRDLLTVLCFPHYILRRIRAYLLLPVYTSGPDHIGNCCVITVQQALCTLRASLVIVRRKDVRVFGGGASTNVTMTTVNLGVVHLRRKYKNTNIFHSTVARIGNISLPTYSVTMALL